MLMVINVMEHSIWRKYLMQWSPIIQIGMTLSVEFIGISD